MEAQEKLDRIRKAVDEVSSLALMDDKYPPMWVDEIEAILDEKICTECGDYPRRGWPLSHYTNCSQHRKGN